MNPLDAAWEKINALGGTGSTAEELAFIYGVERALSVIEELGGMDPTRRADAAHSPVENDSASLKYATSTELDQIAKLALVPPQSSLETLIREYARDLRRNSGGGDDYPWEWAKATANYLETLIERSHAAPQGAPEPTVWLIEWPEDDTNPVRWWNIAHGWMRDANKALHFARKIDAESYLSTMKIGEALKVTEHKFVSLPHALPGHQQGTENG